METLASLYDRPPDFFVRVKVHSHVSKKNSRPIRINPKTQQRFIGKSDALVSAEQWLLLNFLKARHAAKAPLPIQADVHVALRFYFSDFYSKTGFRRKNMPDLSNLLQLPEDILQKSGIIENDSQICSHDGSRRLPGPENALEVWLWVQKD